MNEVNLGEMFYRELKRRVNEKGITGLLDWEEMPKQDQELYRETAEWFAEYFNLSD